MSGLRIISSALLLAAISSTSALAQRVPAGGMWALGGSVGAGVPSDPSLANGLGFAGNLERYLTPRVSVRGQLGGEWSDVVGRHFTGTVNPVYLDGNVVYNWEGGVLHPFVTGGVGMYRYRSSIAGAVQGTDTRPGVDVGGGLEYFYRRHATFTAEALYHVVNKVDTPVTTFNNGQFWTFGVGVKRYF
jgi:hypothetical protein